MDGEQPELTAEEKVAEEAAKVAAGDWGPIFVYGSMLSERAWCALIGRMPEMRSAMLRGHARRSVQCASFAATIEQPGGIVVGQVVSGLCPFERRLLDAVVDDGFVLLNVRVRFLDDTEDVSCTMYTWRDEFVDAIMESEWSYENFCQEHLEEFIALCTDMHETHKAEQLPDDALRELALARRRRATGYEATA
mmetsp:Transcript_107675/g.300008  ORF Transcript_107675/g.300008 Transcript_107675/m.300008 type:complete len:193 (-) Transcript_107675:170-748(-)